MASLSARRIVALSLLSVLGATGCATSAPESAHSSGASAREGRAAAPAVRQKIGAPYQINGVWYVPAREDDYDETGVASWYGPKFHGRKTANGETFDMNEISAAHPTLPLPSMLRVTNLENGRVLTVRVNDRGPFADNRIIDLSKAAAQRLGFVEQGVARVRVEYVGADRRSRRVARASAPAASAGEGVFVQVGSYRHRTRADRVRENIGGPSFVETARVNGRRYQRVLLGPWPTTDAATDAKSAMRAIGYVDAILVRRD